jgi:hypothetical protein
MEGDVFVGNVTRAGKMRNAYKILVGNPSWKCTTWKTGVDENNIKMDKENMCEGVV